MRACKIRPLDPGSLTLKERDSAAERARPLSFSSRRELASRRLWGSRKECGYTTTALSSSSSLSRAVVLMSFDLNEIFRRRRSISQRETTMSTTRARHRETTLFVLSSTSFRPRTTSSDLAVRNYYTGSISLVSTRRLRKALSGRRISDVPIKIVLSELLPRAYLLSVLFLPRRRRSAEDAARANGYARENVLALRRLFSLPPFLFLSLFHTHKLSFLFLFSRPEGLFRTGTLGDYLMEVEHAGMSGIGESRGGWHRRGQEEESRWCAGSGRGQQTDSR